MIALLLLAACSRPPALDDDTAAGADTAAVEEREPIVVPCAEGVPFEGWWGGVIEGAVPVDGTCGRWQNGCLLTNGYTVEAAWHRSTRDTWQDGWDDIRADGEARALVFVQTDGGVDACTITLR